MRANREETRNHFILSCSLGFIIKAIHSFYAFMHVLYVYILCLCIQYVHGARQLTSEQITISHPFHSFSFYPCFVPAFIPPRWAPSRKDRTGQNVRQTLAISFIHIVSVLSLLSLPSSLCYCCKDYSPPTAYSSEKL